MSTESASNLTGGLSAGEENKAEREMLDATHGTLKSSKEVPSWEDPATGIDIRNFGPSERKRFGIPRYGDEKDDLAVYPAEGDETTKLYLRSMKTGGVRGGRSIRAYVDKDRVGKRQGQHVSVTTDYNTEAVTEHDRPKGSKTIVTVHDDDDAIIREREHESDGVGLSPLVAKIVTKGIDAQVQKIKDGQKREVK